MKKKGNLVLGNSTHVLRLDKSIHPVRPRGSKEPWLCQTKPNILPQSDVISMGKSGINRHLFHSDLDVAAEAAATPLDEIEVDVSACKGGAHAPQRGLVGANPPELANAALV
jgi:hypothetical protein